jgi:integrase
MRYRHPRRKELYKRHSEGHWLMQFTAPDGRRVHRSTQTRDPREAEEYLDHCRGRIWRVSKLGERAPHTFAEAADRYLQEQARGGRRSMREMRRWRRWLGQWLDALELEAIGPELIEALTERRLADGALPATVNRLLAQLRGTLRAAHRWGWLKAVPAIPQLPEASGRVRYHTDDEAARLLAELPPHLAAMARFTLATGLRESNVRELEWSEVDLERRLAVIPAAKTKNQRPLSVPLNSEAVLVLRAQLGQHLRCVFTYKGRPIRHAVTNHGWRTALRRAGIADFRWHDLRHTWASWHVMGGTPLHVLMQLGGWSSYPMVLRYAHLSPEHLAEAADRLARPRLVKGGAAHDLHTRPPKGITRER